jgi:hypothetical protein
MKRAGIVAAVCGAVALAACGGGDGGDRLTRDELVSQADAICGEYERKLDALGEPQSIQEVEALADDAKPIVQEGVDKLAALEPPEDLEDDYDRWIELNRESITVIDNLKEAAASGDEARVQQVVEEAQSTENEADAIAGQIGLDECAQD